MKGSLTNLWWQTDFPIFGMFWTYFGTFCLFVNNCILFWFSFRVNYGASYDNVRRTLCWRGRFIVKVKIVGWPKRRGWIGWGEFCERRETRSDKHDLIIRCRAAASLGCFLCSCKCLRLFDDIIYDHTECLFYPLPLPFNSKNEKHF